MTRIKPFGLRFVGPATAARAIAHSAPSWFTEVSSGAPLVWVSTETWADDCAAALRDGAQLVIVDRPVVTSADIDALAGQPVVLCDEYTHVPATREFARQIAGVGVDWAELLMQLSDIRDGLWKSLVTLTACGLPVDTVPVLTPSSGVVADCEAGPARVHITGVSDGNRSVTVKAFGTSGSLELRLGDPDVAGQGDVMRIDENGACLAPTKFQTSRRAALEEAYAALADGLAITNRLDVYAPACKLREQVAGA